MPITEWFINSKLTNVNTNQQCMHVFDEHDETTRMGGTVHHPAQPLPPTDVHLQTRDSDLCPDLEDPWLSKAPAH